MIVHQLAKMPSENLAQMKIDWAYRYDLMQQHSGEHLVSGLFLRLLGGNNKGFHMGADFVTIDIDLPKLSWEDLMLVENAANQKIAENIFVREEMTTREELEQFPIRKQITAEGEIRVVTIDSADCCACCGTHVRSLAEVGMVKILKTEQYKGMTRIHLVCGKRAQQDYVQRFEITRELKKLLNADESSIATRVNAQIEEIERLKKIIYNNKEELANFYAKELIEKKYKNQLRKNIARENCFVGIPIGEKSLNAGESCSRTIGEDYFNGKNSDESILIEILEKIDFEMIENMEKILLEHCDTIVLGSLVDNKILASSKKEIDLGTVFKNELKNFDGRGGGRGARAQAMFASEDGLRGFVALLSQTIV